MTKKEFLLKVSGSEGDILGDLLRLLDSRGIPFCIIGGLAVNAYAEPVVSLDLDIVVRSDKLPALLEALPAALKTKKFPNSLNLTSPKSDLRVQIQTDPRYQEFLPGARKKEVLGYRLPVARIEDVLQGKLWAAADPKRRPSKRQKDLSDILRLVEAKPELARMVPAVLKKKLDL